MVLSYMRKLPKKVRFGGSNEMKKTLKDIEKLENGYSIQDFLIFLQEECNTHKAIEKNEKRERQRW